jgi:hypothetical protein
MADVLAATVENAPREDNEPSPVNEAQDRAHPPDRPHSTEDATGSTEDATESVDPRIDIKVRDNQGGEMTFKVKLETKLGKLMNVYCDKNGKNPQQVRFLYDGVRITADNTPGSVRLDYYHLCRHPT